MPEEKPVFRMKEGQIPVMIANFVSYPKTGGTLSNIEGITIPYKGFPDVKILYSLDILKRLIKLDIQFVLKRWHLIPFLAPSWRKILKNFNELSEVSLRRHNIIIERYCSTAIELIRVADKTIKDLDLLELFMIVVTFYEYDWAYRTRSQFCLSLLDKEAFITNPYKELRRLLGEMRRREGVGSLREKYDIFDKLIWLSKIPKYKKFLISFVSEMDMSVFVPDDIDKYWWSLNKDGAGNVEFDFN